MRLHLFFVPLALFAAPALAQQSTAPAQQVPQVQQPTAESVTIPPQLSDPRLADRLVDALHVLSKSFLALPVGEVEAALEGRQATSADKRRTVRSESGMTDRELRQQIEQSRPAMRASQQALVRALPAMMKGLAEAQKELERATANLPDPTYPKR